MRIAKPGFQRNSFDRAQTEVFTVKGIDVGYIYSVTVRIVSS